MRKLSDRKAKVDMRLSDNKASHRYYPSESGMTSKVVHYRPMTDCPRPQGKAGVVQEQECHSQSQVDDEPYLRLLPHLVSPCTAPS
jgi:hypothetical protein